MLKRIDLQNKNLQKLLSTATSRITSIFDSVKKKLDSQANALVSRLSEIVEIKLNQNAHIRDELMAAESDFELMFNQSLKSKKSHSNSIFQALEEILSLYSNISTNYINNPDYQNQLDSRHLDEAALFDMDAIHYRLNGIHAAADTLYADISNHFAQVPALKLELLIGAPEFKMKTAASFNTGHKDIKIGALAHIPHLDCLVTGGTEGSLKMWSLQDLKLVSKIVAHKNEITRIQYIAQKDMVATGGRDGEVKLWKIMNHTLNFVGNISYDNAAVLALHYLPNGNLLATGGDGPEIRLWEMVFAGSEPKSQIIKTGSARITSICRLDHASYLVAGTDSGALLVYGYNVNQHKLVYRLTGHKKDVYAMDCDQERSLLVTGSDDGCILVWLLRVSDGQCLTRMRKEGSQIRSLVFIAEKDVVLTTHGDQIVRAWNTEKGVMCGSYLNETQGGALCRLEDQKNQVISAFSDNVKIWSFQ